MDLRGAWGQAVQEGGIEPYGYAVEAEPAGSCEDLLLPQLNAEGQLVRSGAEAAVEPTPCEYERRLAQASRTSFEAGRERGRAEGRAAERDAQHASRADETQQRAEHLTRLMGEFGEERHRYMERVEHDVVQLALAVAARILRREAQMDPLLLLGAVRVALGQLSAATEVLLKVPAADAALWSEAVALLPVRTLRPQVIAQDDLRLGECLLETDLGSVDLGLRAQLSEIERGFFDRAVSAAVPAAAAEQS